MRLRWLNIFHPVLMCSDRLTPARILRLSLLQSLLTKRESLGELSLDRLDFTGFCEIDWFVKYIYIYIAILSVTSILWKIFSCLCLSYSFWKHAVFKTSRFHSPRCYFMGRGIKWTVYLPVRCQQVSLFVHLDSLSETVLLS